jgi:hypothetical protein
MAFVINFSLTKSKEKIMEIFEIRNYLADLLSGYLIENDKISEERLKALVELPEKGKVKLTENLIELPEEFPIVEEVNGYIKFKELDAFTKDYLLTKLKKYKKFLKTLKNFKQPKSIEDTVILARKLFKEGLYFEVHEVLESVWMTEYGKLREFLQALIQIAVAYYHLNNYNLRGYELLLNNAMELLKQYSGTLCTVDVEKLKEKLQNTTPDEIVCF